VPYIKQEEPLKVECQHFLDCIANGSASITGGQQGADVVRILEAASASLQQNGAAVEMTKASGTTFLRHKTKNDSK
jgi:predicted dehydrogenase